MPNSDSGGVRPIRGVRIKRQRRRVRLDFSSPEAIKRSRERFYSTQSTVGRPMHWFLWAYTPKGKPVALGPFATEGEAEQKIAEEGLVEEVIRQYPTIQLAKATQIFKNEITEQRGEDYRPIDDVVVKTKHQKSLDRAKKKRF